MIQGQEFLLSPLLNSLLNGRMARGRARRSCRTVKLTLSLPLVVPLSPLAVAVRSAALKLDRNPLLRDRIEQNRLVITGRPALLILLEHPLSSYVQKVKIALREKGVSFTTEIPPELGSGRAGGACHTSVEKTV